MGERGLWKFKDNFTTAFLWSSNPSAVAKKHSRPLQTEHVNKQQMRLHCNRGNNVLVSAKHPAQHPSHISAIIYTTLKSILQHTYTLMHSQIARLLKKYQWSAKGRNIRISVLESLKDAEWLYWITHSRKVATSEIRAGKLRYRWRW